MALDIDNSKGELVIDPHRSKEKYKAWNKKISGISEKNNEAIVLYLEDMRRGINISPKATKGKRGYNRLLSQRHRLKKIAVYLEEYYHITDIMARSDEEIKVLKRSIMDLIEKMEDGEIVRADGKRYTAVADYIKGFKAWWHWHMTYMHNEHGKILPDICEYITAKDRRKPQFEYFGEVGSMSVEQGFKKMMSHAKRKYQILMAFLFDSGIRCPTELMNVKRKDITPIKDTPYYTLNIREETSKTFGRKIKLMLCHELLRDFLEENQFEPDEFLFKISPPTVNKYLKRLGERALGKKGITMYDFRHNSACYWLPRYDKENALLYRFGWKDSKMIHYYTELMGMRDTIQEENMLVDITKTELEKELEQERKQRILLDERLTSMSSKMEKINAFMNELFAKNPDIVDMIVEKARMDKAGKEEKGHSFA